MKQTRRNEIMLNIILDFLLITDFYSKVIWKSKAKLFQEAKFLIIIFTYLK